MNTKYRITPLPIKELCARATKAFTLNDSSAARLAAYRDKRYAITELHSRLSPETVMEVVEFIEYMSKELVYDSREQRTHPTTDARRAQGLLSLLNGLTPAQRDGKEE